MVVDAIFTLASLHPGHDGEYNAFNPGLLFAAGPRNERVWPYVIGGAYYDSHEHVATVLGAGCRFGDPAFGIDITLAHVHGSDVEKYPVVPIPSIYAGHGRWTARFILNAQAVALGVQYRLLE